MVHDLQIEEREGWQARGYEQGLAAARHEARQTVQSLIVAHLTSRTQHNAVNATLKVTDGITRHILTMVQTVFVEVAT